MKNIKYTQGEWTVEGSNVLTNERLIANCLGNGINITDEDRANAKLIAAAPDMLKALTKAHEVIWHVKYQEAVNSGAGYEKAKEFANNHTDVVSIELILDKIAK